MLKFKGPKTSFNLLCSDFKARFRFFPGIVRNKCCSTLICNLDHTVISLGAKTLCASHQAFNIIGETNCPAQKSHSPQNCAKLPQQSRTLSVPKICMEQQCGGGGPAADRLRARLVLRWNDLAKVNPIAQHLFYCHAGAASITRQQSAPCREDSAREHSF